MTIPSAQRVTAKILDTIPYDTLEQGTADAIQELDRILAELYASVSRLQQPLMATEVQHLATRLLEQCCCIHYRLRKSGKTKGDYCPDCITHGAEAGMEIHTIKLTRKGR